MRHALCLLIGLWSAGSLSAQDAVLLARLGTDTVSIERFRLGAERLEGELLVRSPRVVHRSYVVQFAPDGRVLRVEFVSVVPGAPATAPPLLRAAATFVPDSVIVEMERPTGTQTQRVAMPADVVPMIGDWWAGYQLMTARARRSRSDSTRFRTWQVGAPSLGWTDAVRLGRDSFLLIDANQTHRVRVDDGGRLLAAARPVQQFLVERVAAADLPAIAAAWTAREQRSGPLVALSPRDTMRATVGGAAISVDYSRPSKRGRVIFGGVVPWHEPWRTGANQPTQFTTDRALEIAGVRVPAGSYALWTVPSPGGWRLLLNSGGSAAYEPWLDLFRFDMAVAALPQPVEQLSIRVVPAGAGEGALTIEWDTIRASIPFSVVP